MVRNFLNFLLAFYTERALLFRMTGRDLTARYLGSYFGLVWAFIQPSVTVFIFWFVFDVGFKAAPVKDYPFVLWLMTGMIPWFFFAEALSNGTSAIVDNSYLVNKIVFRVSMLPVIKILSAVIVHLFFVLVIFIFFWGYGIEISIHAVQVGYYLFFAVVVLLGLNWLTSSLVVFFKDMGQVVAMAVQFGFWFTPIFWSVDILPDRYRWIIKLNPIFYITEGYRDAFIHKVWFWQHDYSLYIWVMAAGIFLFGAIVFSRLRPHFSDVL